MHHPLQKMRLACNQPRWWNHFSQESGVSAKLIRFKEVLSGQSKMLMGSLLKFVCIGWRFFPFSINFFILFQYMEIMINGKALFCMFSSFISNRLSIYFGFWSSTIHQARWTFLQIFEQVFQENWPKKVPMGQLFGMPPRSH